MSAEFEFTLTGIETIRELTADEIKKVANVPESHIRLLKEHGVCRIDGGFIQLDYPPDMKDILPKWNFTDEHYEIVAHTALGDYFVWTGEDFLMADVNNGEVFDVSPKPEFFYNYFLDDKKYLSQAHYRDQALGAIRQLGPLKEDEALAFVPYLIMGGNPQEEALEKVKLKEHLDILAQLTLNS